MPTFADIWKRWKKGEAGPLALAAELVRTGYACPYCTRLQAAGAACDCPASQLARSRASAGTDNGGP